MIGDCTYCREIKKIEILSLIGCDVKELHTGHVVTEK